MADDGKIVLNVRKENKSEAQFRIKPTSKLEKVFDAWCKQTGDNFSDIVFLHNGNLLNANQQANEADLRDGDVINVQQKQVGGF